MIILQCLAPDMNALLPAHTCVLQDLVRDFKDLLRESSLAQDMRDADPAPRPQVALAVHTIEAAV